MCPVCHGAIIDTSSMRREKRDNASEYLRGQLEANNLPVDVSLMIKEILHEKVTPEEKQRAKALVERQKRAQKEREEKAEVEFQNNYAPSGTGFYVAGAIFLVLSILLYILSVSNNLGVANIQATVFAAAAFVLAGVSFAAGRLAGLICSLMKSKR